MLSAAMRGCFVCYNYRAMMKWREMPSWRDKVRGCFGVLDLYFGRQHNDEKRAKVMLREANKAGATKEEVWKVLTDYMNTSQNESVTPPHIEEQRKRFERMWKLRR
jgi:hypothetical protein